MYMQVVIISVRDVDEGPERCCLLVAGQGTRRSRVPYRRVTRLRHTSEHKVQTEAGCFAVKAPCAST